MSDLRTALTGRTENTVTVVDNRQHVEPDEPKIVRVVKVVVLDAPR